MRGIQVSARSSVHLHRLIFRRALRSRRRLPPLMFLHRHILAEMSSMYLRRSCLKNGSAKLCLNIALASCTVLRIAGRRSAVSNALCLAKSVRKRKNCLTTRLCTFRLRCRFALICATQRVLHMLTHAEPL